MPRIFRAMKREGDYPLVAESATGLGARPNEDIPVGADGNVEPDTGGMSVAPEGSKLPFHRIPKRLKPRLPIAAGGNDLFCWRFGEGPFVESVVNDTLTLKPDRHNHGTVQPRSSCAFREFQQSLSNTREQWVLVLWEDVLTT